MEGLSCRFILLSALRSEAVGMCVCVCGRLAAGRFWSMCIVFMPMHFSGVCT